MIDHVVNECAHAGIAARVLDRVAFLPGNMFEVKVEEPCDVVIMSHVFHHFDEPTCIRLLRRAAGWLADDGRLLINDFIPTDGPAAEPTPYLFSAIRLTWTNKGRSYRRSEYQRMLAEAGLTDIGLHPVPNAGTQLLVAKRG